MNEEDEDKPTVILDFSKLKEELNQEELLNDQEVDQLFSKDTKVESDFSEQTEHEDDQLFSNDLEEEINGIEEDVEEKENNIYLLDYNNDYFKTNDNFASFADQLQIIEQIEQLNDVLSEAVDCIIVFYYNAFPKVINQLTGQIKTKFPNAKTIIIAKNLSAEKAQQHSQSKYGADSYLSDPFDENELLKTINTLLE
jgi:CheY-like chemotaxis protein